MLVGQRMSRPIITVTQELPITDALNLLKQENIRRAPVVRHGKLVGIVTIADIMNASPSQATSLSVWEINYLLSKITVKDVMTKDVKTVPEDMPIEEAARLMADTKIGGLPVMRGDEIVGMITETDLFKVFLELMGARDKGVRVTASIEDKPGELAKVTKAIAHAGGNFVSFGFFSGEDAATKVLTFKVAGVKQDEIRSALKDVVKKFWDIRQS